MLKSIKALLGNTDVQLELARESWFGPAEKRNLRRALFWARQARRNAPFPESMMLAVILNAAGRTEEALRETFLVMDRAARQDDKHAQYNLGRCYEEGEGVAKDPEQALYWYTKASLNGVEDADLAIARLYATGLVSSQQK